MAKTITIKAPAEGGRTIELTGQVALLRVGERKHKFFIHDGTLTDYRSGCRVGSIRGLQLQAYVARGSYGKQLSDRDAAQALLDNIEAQHGLAKVESELAKYPTING